ncbi:MAG TPA: class I SAM-dependent methyltransferase [Candidatus Eisenbacteria bacterium]|nr:class I SAM-dependent methyltransferase [Candidatus Eisenbacteria bacterium]
MDAISSRGMWTGGDPYERYVGRWSRMVAAELLAWLAMPAGLRWLDVGCGTGALSEAILPGAPGALTAVDRSASYVAHTSARLRHAGVRLAVADAAALPFPDSSFDVVVSGLMLNFVPDPARAIGEAARVAVRGGTVAAYVWDYADGMGLVRVFWDAAGDLDPRARALDEGARFSLCRPGPLADLFAAALGSVQVRAIEVPTLFRDFDDYWLPFLGGQGPAPAYAASLDRPDLDRLRERIRSRLVVEADGSIRLTARAWAASGRA